MGIPLYRWMVDFMENPKIKWMMIWGYPYDLGNLYVSLDLRLLCSADFSTEIRHFPPVNGNSYGNHGPSIDDLALEHGSQFSIAMFPGGEIHLIVDYPKKYPIVSHCIVGKNPTIYYRYIMIYLPNLP